MHHGSPIDVDVVFIAESEELLPGELHAIVRDNGALRVRAYDEQGAEASLEDAMDQLDEARDVALLRLAK